MDQARSLRDANQRQQLVFWAPEASVGWAVPRQLTTANAVVWKFEKVCAFCESAFDTRERSRASHEAQTTELTGARSAANLKGRNEVSQTSKGCPSAPLASGRPDTSAARRV